MPPRSQTAEPPARPAQPQTERALAEREQRQQHPLVLAIDQRMPAITKLLPAGVDADRFQSIVMSVIVQNTEILTCEPNSVIDAILTAAREGLEPTGASGGAWLVPFYDKGVRKAQLVRDYRGIAKLLIAGGTVSRIDTGVARPGDEFSYSLGAHPDLRHTPKIGNDEPAHSWYAVAWLPGIDAPKVEVMTRAQVEHIRDKTKSKNREGEIVGPWATDFDQMGRKTAMKRLANNQLPISPAVRGQLAAEDEAEFGGVTIEHVPATDLADKRAAIHDRTRRLTGGTEQPAGPSVPAGEAAPGRAADGVESRRRSSGGASTPPTNCAHPPSALEAVDEGVRCTLCGFLVAQRDTTQPRSGGAQAGATAATPARGRGRSARSDRDVAEQPPSSDGPGGRAKAATYAVASKRGLDHDAIHRLAAVLFTSADDRAKFSCSELVEAEWEQLRDSIARAPEGKSPEAVSVWVGGVAASALGLTDEVRKSEELWTEHLDPLAAKLMGEPAGDLSGPQWIEVALLLEAGERPAESAA